MRLGPRLQVCLLVHAPVRRLRGEDLAQWLWKLLVASAARVLDLEDQSAGVKVTYEGD